MENYREGNKVKHRVISNISKWPESLIDTFEKTLKSENRKFNHWLAAIFREINGCIIDYFSDCQYAVYYKGTGGIKAGQTENRAKVAKNTFMEK